MCIRVVEFLQCQPDRDRNWRGWLVRTAQREAWSLEGRLRSVSYVGEDAMDHVYANARVIERDPYMTHLDVEDAFAVLDHLPERLRRVALLRALGMRHKDIGELTGDSLTRVGQLVARADAHIYEVLEERGLEDPGLPPRARRLAELQRRPPRWLVERIGRPPRTVTRKVSTAETLRAWRRAALALNDLRETSGRDLDSVQQPVEPELADVHARAAKAVEDLAHEGARTARRSIER